MSWLLKEILNLFLTKKSCFYTDSVISYLAHALALDFPHQVFFLCTCFQYKNFKSKVVHGLRMAEFVLICLKQMATRKIEDAQRIF